MNRCIIDGCSNEGRHSISIRCRRPNTSAIWAPNSNAFLCDEHAERGCIVDVQITPAKTKTITTTVSGGGYAETRTTSIVHNSVE